MPILQVAWAEGGISPAERKLILDVARHRGVAEGSPADRQLAEWLAHQPPADVFSRADRLVGAMLAAGSSTTHDLSADDLVKYCETIAAASGGLLGLGKVSSGERAAIEQIQKALKSR
jgi:tellurite resistance protein